MVLVDEQVQASSRSPDLCLGPWQILRLDPDPDCGLVRVLWPAGPCPAHLHQHRCLQHQPCLALLLPCQLYQWLMILLHWGPEAHPRPQELSPCLKEHLQMT